MAPQDRESYHGGMFDLALDVRRIPVVLPSASEGPLEAVVFLPFVDPPGSPGLIGRLNDKDAFVPVMVDDKIRLLAKASIAMLACREAPPELSEIERFLARTQALRVRLRGGASVSGTASVFLPDDRSRLSDFLNLPERFFHLATESGTVIVNKDWIESVEPVEAT